MYKVWRLPVAILSVVLLAGSMLTTLTTHAAPAVTPVVGGLHVSGNQILDANNQVVQLRGVNRSGTEYACVQGWGIFDGPSDAASVQAMASWGVNSVRVPLNEDCWLGINGVPSQYAGQNYINAITGYVNLLNANGIYAELSLIWGAPGTFAAGYQPAAPDADHSPAMWQSMAQTFAGNSKVILAPWGETTVSWDCFYLGGTYGGSTNCDATYGGANTPYTVAGMDQAVSVMRGAGYQGIISIPCTAYANNCNSGSPEFYGWGGTTGDWVSHEPADPAHNLIAEAHVYGKNTCDTAQCLNDTIGPQLSVVPFIFGETGETYDGSDCNNSSANISTFMNWADQNGVGYMAWTWDTWGSCNLALITDYNGTPYGVYGTYVRQHLQSFLSGGTPPPSPSPTNTPTNTPTSTPTSTPTNTPSPSPSPSPPPPASFTFTPVVTVSVAFTGGAGTNITLRFVVTDPANHIVRVVNKTEAPMPNGTVVVTATFPAVYKGVAEANGTKLLVEAKVLDGTGAVIADQTDVAEYIVP